MPEPTPPASGEAGLKGSAPAIILAFDVGGRRIGIARGDTVSCSASPAGVVGAVSGVPRWEEIERLLRDWRPDRLIVGLPYNVDGSESTQSALAREFAAQLLTRYSVPVELVDERYTSLEAQVRLKEARQSGVRRRRIARSDIDAGAACIILERWLAGLR
jgi:putative Holliday junction resolvase